MEGEQLSAAAAPLCVVPPPWLPPGVPRCGCKAGARCSGGPGWFWGEGWTHPAYPTTQPFLSGEQIIERHISGALGWKHGSLWGRADRNRTAVSYKTAPFQLGLRDGGFSFRL